MDLLERAGVQHAEQADHHPAELQLLLVGGLRVDRERNLNKHSARFFDQNILQYTTVKINIKHS